jgi:glutaminyl-peptide cyclotransferase
MVEAKPHFYGMSTRASVSSDGARRRGAAASLAALAALCVVLTATHAEAQTVVPRVEAVYPHDAAAFTQGLELFEGKLFESTGLTGRSTVRRVAVTTGMVEKSIDLDASLFGEGMTRVDRTLIQLTYTTGIAIVYDLDTFAELKRFTYAGQGWGLCFDGTDLVMSNGTDKLVFRDPATFVTRREVTVRRNGTAIDNLNELECVGSVVYSNVWRTDEILRIDKATGDVLTTIDASALLTADEKQNAEVLNGIAYDASKRRFYITGKYWPKLFEVSFAFDPGGGDGGLIDAGIVDAGHVDGGDRAETGPPRDAADAPRDILPADVGRPRDASSLADAADGSSRDTSGDAAADDAPAGPLDVGTPPLVDAPPLFEAGTIPAGARQPSSCACRTSCAFRREHGPAVAVLLAAMAFGRLRRSTRQRARRP